MAGLGQTEPGLPCPQCKKASGWHRAQNLVRKDRLEGVGIKDDASQNSFCIFGSQTFMAHSKDAGVVRRRAINTECPQLS